MKNIQRSISFLQFLLRSKGLHRVHSPFVFHLYEKLIRRGEHYSDFEQLSSIRTALLTNHSRIQRAGIGASRKPKEESISQIAARILSTQHWCEAFYRIAKHANPQCIVELGSGLGLSTLYWAKAAQQAQVHTFEGDAELANLDRALFEREKASNIILHEGLFEETLPVYLQTNPRIDIAFIDGDHTYDATIGNFRMMLPFLHENSTVIFDDIHWSSGMERAWNEIKTMNEVQQSIDFFRLGMVFFRTSQARQHFNLRGTYFGF